METVVVTRHPGLVALLTKRGIIAEGTPVLSHVSEEQVRGKHVIGVLPLNLAASAAKVTEIPMNLPAEMRGKELTLEECEKFAGGTVTYRVTIENTGCICNAGEHEERWRGSVDEHKARLGHKRCQDWPRCKRP